MPLDFVVTNQNPKKLFAIFAQIRNYASPLQVMVHQQRERDSNSNINRDMVLLVILVVMIQARSFTLL